ncbi:MAG: ErfK/YbiS/YcfS/YnhG family protein [Chitinophagaceae bacterium]|nr:ErfK/YbiS/YcfS/YnhG family protein [Chitinophagaceae bacterium]
MVFFLSRNDSASSPALEVITHAEADTVVTILPLVDTSTIPVITQSEGKYEYLEIIEGCAHGTAGLCIWAYAGPGLTYEKIYQLEKGMLLKVVGTKVIDGQTWYHVYFDEWIRYPERSPKDWYVPAVAGRIIRAGGIETVLPTTPSNKRIVVDLSDQMIYAYDGDTEFLATKVSTGEDTTPTPTGTFTIFRKTPTRYMQGPLPGVTDIEFDLPGVSWDMYFTQGGAAIHGTYWHNNYGTTQSDGCVNLPPEVAKILYDWAPLGTKVAIQK